MFEWEIRVQAFQNSVAIAMCNRVGTEDDMRLPVNLCNRCLWNLICKAGDRRMGALRRSGSERIVRLRNKKPYTQLRRTEDYL